MTEWAGSPAFVLPALCAVPACAPACLRACPARPFSLTLSREAGALAPCETSAFVAQLAEGPQRARSVRPGLFVCLLTPPGVPRPKGRLSAFERGRMTAISVFQAKRRRASRANPLFSLSLLHCTATGRCTVPRRACTSLHGTAGRSSSVG